MQQDLRATPDRDGLIAPPDGLTRADYALLWHLALRLQDCTSLAEAEAMAAEARASDQSQAVSRAMEATIGPVLHALGERDRLRALATRDPLTGLANRRLMEEALDVQLGEAARLGRPLAVVLLDLDRFRDYNRRHGHLAGDEALRALASLLEAVRRGEELACRYGGDEFVLIMPSATATEALVRLEGLERRLAEHAAARTKSPLDPVTASIGIAEAAADGSDPAALIAAADEAMYRAKQAGGNRICLAAASRPVGGPARGNRP